MNATSLISDWREKFVYVAPGTQPQTPMENDKMKVIVEGLEAGQQLPPHAAAAPVYHFLEGDVWMTVDGERLTVGPGRLGCR